MVGWHDDHLQRVGVDSLLIPNSTLAELQALTLTQTRKDGVRMYIHHNRLFVD